MPLPHRHYPCQRHSERNLFRPLGRCERKKAVRWCDVQIPIRELRAELGLAADVLVGQYRPQRQGTVTFGDPQLEVYRGRLPCNVIRGSVQSRRLLHVLDGLHPLLQFGGQTTEHQDGEWQAYSQIMNKIDHCIIHAPRVWCLSIDLRRLVKCSDLFAVEDNHGASAATLSPSIRKRSGRLSYLRTSFHSTLDPFGWTAS